MSQTLRQQTDSTDFPTWQSRAGTWPVWVSRTFPLWVLPLWVTWSRSCCPIRISFFLRHRIIYNQSPIPHPQFFYFFPPSGFVLLTHSILALPQSGSYLTPVRYALLSPLYPCSISFIPAHLMRLIGVGHPVIFVRSGDCRSLTSTDSPSRSLSWSFLAALMLLPMLSDQCLD